MLKKDPSARWLKWKHLITVPVILILTIILAFKVDYLQPDFPLLKECIDTKSDLEDQKSCTQQTFLKKIYQTIIYPLEARKSNLTGITVVGFTFGQEGLVNYKFLHNDHDALEAAFKPVIETLQNVQFDIKSGSRFSFSVPVKFILDGKEGMTEVEDLESLHFQGFPPFRAEDYVVVTGYAIQEKQPKSPAKDSQPDGKFGITLPEDRKGDPLFKIFDHYGKMVRKETAITKEYVEMIDTETIERVSVFKGERAKVKYGLEGVHGVVEIYLKEGGVNLLKQLDHK